MGGGGTLASMSSCCSFVRSDAAKSGQQLGRRRSRRALLRTAAEALSRVGLLSPVGSRSAARSSQSTTPSMWSSWPWKRERQHGACARIQSAGVGRSVGRRRDKGPGSVLRRRSGCASQGATRLTVCLAANPDQPQDARGRGDAVRARSMIDRVWAGPSEGLRKPRIEHCRHIHTASPSTKGDVAVSPLANTPCSEYSPPRSSRTVIVPRAEIRDPVLGYARGGVVGPFLLVVPRRVVRTYDL